MNSRRQADIVLYMKVLSWQNVHAYGTLEQRFSLKEKVLNTWRNTTIFSAWWTEYSLKICRDGGSILPSSYLNAAKKLGRCMIVISTCGSKKSKNCICQNWVKLINVVEIEQNNKIESCLLIEFRSLSYPLASQWVSCSYTPWLWPASSSVSGEVAAAILAVFALILAMNEFRR